MGIIIDWFALISPSSLPSKGHVTTTKFFEVKGAICRPRTHAGARRKIYQFAAEAGLYPPGLNADTTFRVLPCQDTARSVLTFSVHFEDRVAAAKFLIQVTSYLTGSGGMMYFCDNSGEAVATPRIVSVASYEIDPDQTILPVHYRQRRQDGAEAGEEASVGPAVDSPPIDVVTENRSETDDMTAVTVLSRRDPVFLHQRIENASAFALADPESAHIFPHAKCVGKYEWLDDKPYNRLALSRDLHLNFDGSARGRAKRRKTAPSFTLKPLPRKGKPLYKTVDHNSVLCYEFPLEIVIFDNDKAEALLSHLSNHAQLNRHNTQHWTITGAEVRIFYPRDKLINLVAEEQDGSAPAGMMQELVTAIPGVDDLSTCWSNSAAHLLRLEEAEVLEKLLRWNYIDALRTQSSLML